MSDHTGTEAPRHIVTYTTFKGLPAIRIQGPQAHDAEGEEVTVTRKDGSTEKEVLTERVWRGLDDKNLKDRKATFEPVGLYRFVPKPRIKEPFKQ